MDKEHNITILSDLGNSISPVARGLLLQISANINIVDVTLNATESNLQEAAYHLISTYPYFPKATIHIIACGIFNTPSKILIIKYKEHYFIAPDNGILPMCFGENLNEIIIFHEFATNFTIKEWILHTKKACEYLLNNNHDISFNKQAIINTQQNFLQPIILGNRLECNILYIDSYENIILSITRLQFDQLVGKRKFSIKIRGKKDINNISNNYCDVPEQEALCKFNSAGFLEIAISHGKMTSLLGLQLQTAREIWYQTIKIFLE